MIYVVRAIWMTINKEKKNPEKSQYSAAIGVGTNLGKQQKK